MVRLGCPGSISALDSYANYSCALHPFDIREFDHFRPFPGFIRDQPCEIAGRAREDRAAKVNEASLEPGIGESRIDPDVDMLDDPFGCILGRTYAKNRARLKSRQKVTHRGNARQRLRFE